MSNQQNNTPDDFWQGFTQVLDPAIHAGPEWKTAWSAGGREWSAWIFPRLAEFFRHLGYSGRDQVQQEGFGRIDYCLMGLGNKIEVAIEHENTPEKWTEEWSKLQRFKEADLRVVIGYGTPERWEVVMNRAKAETLALPDRDDRPMLLILSSRNGQAGDKFRAWEWRQEGFHELPGEIVLPEA